MKELCCCWYGFESQSGKDKLVSLVPVCILEEPFHNKLETLQQQHQKQQTKEKKANKQNPTVGKNRLLGNYGSIKQTTTRV